MGGAVVFQRTALCEGDSVPVVEWKVKVRTASDLELFRTKTVSSQDLFSHRRVVVFSFPAVLTPMTSSYLVLCFEKAYSHMRQLGIDEVYCISINQPLEMREWALSLYLKEELFDTSHPLNPGNFQKIKFIPDTDGAFTNAMGLNPRGGFWHYAAVFNDMVVEKIFMDREDALPCSNNSFPGSQNLKVIENFPLLKYIEEHHKGQNKKKNICSR